MELRGAEDVESTLVPKDLPEETSTKSMKKPAMVAVAIGIILVIIVAVVIAVSMTGPPDENYPDGAEWTGNPLKRPFSVALTTDTTGSVEVKGQLQICGQAAGCCTTDKFVFQAPTLVKLELKNCSEFKLNKNQGMSIKVLKDDPANVQIRRIVMILEDGASFLGRPTEALVQSTWSQDIPLQAINRKQKTMIKVNFRRDHENTKDTFSIDGARIEIKRRGESVAGCLSNPLPSNPLPGENRGTFDLDDLETLGTCFGNSIKGAGDSLMIRFLPPAWMPYTVTRITLKSHEELTSGWWVKLKQQNDENDGWMTATFDDDFIG